jgi:hypothetical protein
VALAILRDTKNGEALVNILACLDTLEEAEEYIRNVGCKDVTHADIHVCRACEWTFPNGDPSSGKTNYRHPELQKIMDAADKNPKAVKKYKEWKAEQDSKTESESKGGRGDVDTDETSEELRREDNGIGGEVDEKV